MSRAFASSPNPSAHASRSNTNETHVDILPVTQWGSLGVSPQASFMDALSRTAFLAVMEQALCQTSTASALAGVGLTMLNTGDEISGSDLPSTYDANTQAIAARVLNEYPNCYVFVPSALPFSGFWAVDGQSGALIRSAPRRNRWWGVDIAVHGSRGLGQRDRRHRLPR